MNYEPGTVAELTLENGVKTRGFRTSEAGWRVASDGDLYYDREVTDVRPVVVLDLDLESPAIKTGELVKYLREGYFNMTADQIERQTKSLKPEEPKVLGAQVLDCDDETWVRNAQGEWINLHGAYGVDAALKWGELCDKYSPIRVSVNDQ